MSQSALSSEGELTPSSDSGSPPRSMTPRLMRGAILAVVVSVIVYAGLLLHADMNNLLAEFARLSPSRICALVAVSLVHVVLRFVRWQYYLRRLELRVGWFESALICVAGFAMSLSPGKLGEVFKSVMLQRSTRAPLARTAPLVLAERITDVGGLVLLCALALAVALNAWGAALLLTLGVAVVGLIVNSPQVGVWVVNCVSSPRCLRRYRSKLTEALETMRVLLSLRAYCVGTLLAIGAWGAHGVTLGLAAGAFSELQLGMLQAQIAYAGPLLAGTLAMLPGGVGLTEATMAGAIVQLGGANATLAVATAVTIIVRGVTFWATMGLGASSLLVWQLGTVKNVHAPGSEE